jgi:hypothetical protein
MLKFGTCFLVTFVAKCLKKTVTKDLSLAFFVAFQLGTIGNKFF